MRYFFIIFIFILNACGTADSGSPTVTVPADSPCAQKAQTESKATSLVDSQEDKAKDEKEKCPVEQAKGELSKITEEAKTEAKTESSSSAKGASTSTATATSTSSSSSSTATATTTTTTNACTSDSTRTKYQAQSVSYGQTCASETQTALCLNGVLGDYSGSYTFDSCSVEAGSNCGSTANGASVSRTRYQASSVSYGSTCSSETQTSTCTNGTFSAYSGTFTAESCSVGAPADCGATLHGQTASRTRYQASTVAFGQTCSSETQTATCNNGTLNYSGTYTFASCSINDPAACGATANGAYASRTRYQTSSVAYGSTCVSETQQALCTNGTLGAYSGSYAFDSCSVNSPAACGATPHGGTATRTKYQAATVAYGSTCVSETQSATCNNGTFGAYSGSYTFDSCSVNAPSNCGAVNHGNSVSRTRYQKLTVTWNASCSSESQTSTCNNGTMSAYTGTYTYTNCAVRHRYFEETFGTEAQAKALAGLKTNGTTVLIVPTTGSLRTTPNMTVNFTAMGYGNTIYGYAIDAGGRYFMVEGNSATPSYVLRTYTGVWSNLSTGPNSLNTGSGQITILVSDIYSQVSASKVWAATPSGIYYSTDTGVTFTLSTTEQARSIQKVFSSYIVVNTESNGVAVYYTSTYAMIRNFTTSTGLPSNQVNASWCNDSVSAINSKWVVGTPSGLALSTDGGNTFVTKTTANGLPSNNILSLYVPNLDGQTIYVGTEGGLAYSTDGGSTWTTKYVGSDANINGIIGYGADIWMTSSSWGLWKNQ